MKFDVYLKMTGSSQKNRRKRTQEYIENIFLDDKNLEKMFNEWYTRAYAPDLEATPPVEGDFGGSIHGMDVKKIGEGTYKIRIDYGSVKQKRTASTELNKIICKCGYRVIDGKVGGKTDVTFSIGR